MLQNNNFKGVLSDEDICLLCDDTDNSMISPFYSDSNNLLNDGKTKCMSYGLSSYGYDVRLSEDIKLYRACTTGHLTDPKNFNPENLISAPIFKDSGGTYFILPSNNVALGHTLETFNIPNGVTALVLGKSSYARCGIDCLVTPIESGFKGQVVIELSNNTRTDCKIYVGEGICQFVFLAGNKCKTTYGDRSGKYQGQKGITYPKV